ncbi:PKD domain-containing protein [Methanosarcina sp. KYL-1]|uniref:PKD domain-containing protein n=1 Tax=Methanosarcina sp. KYL-1 TaxID=2602068 RepID=UPI002101C965|nr:PKD domain-containing protein [Methanosarcina sp. KYL-1]MCQ1535147.1 PKD domain-containing protein [Methanosarcina sp. KYL-1]
MLNGETFLAPENPEFIRYRENAAKGMQVRVEKASTEKYSVLSAFSTEIPAAEPTLGLVPAPVDLSHLSSTQDFQEGVEEIALYAGEDVGAPALYDLRALNRVSSVKNQGSAGVCWAFATYASLESYLKPGEERDFSENNMKNLLSSAYPDGFDREHDDGGNHFKSTAYLARWTGPVDEKDDPYAPTSGYSPAGLPARKHVQEVLFLPDRTGYLDNDDIKWAVQNYGTLYTTMYYSSSDYNSLEHSYYYRGTLGANHAVAIVGWDDSYDRNKFSQVPPGDGAFIVKNSWGTYWGESGYFYISYYDSKIGRSNAIFTAEAADNYEEVYQYDPLGWVRTTGYGKSVAWGANVFSAKAEESLNAVSFYTTGSNTGYEIYIYTDPENGPLNPAGPAFTVSGTIPAAGYHTIPLETGVQLREGQKFSVVVKFNTPGYYYPIALEAPVSGWSSKATANSGESYISSDGKFWTDATKNYANSNVCIKAFTGRSSEPSPVEKPPVAGFFADKRVGQTPLTVLFADESTGSPTAWKWEFGDGYTSTQQNPTHTYENAGSYTVKLTASNPAGTDTETKYGYITAEETVSPPAAGFFADRTSGQAPLAVRFADISTGSPTAWKWEFGDGYTSTQQNPTHTYENAGSYTVKLTASNLAGTDTETKYGYISVGEAAGLLKADFSANQRAGNAPLTVIFTDESTGDPTSWRWEFGDGYTSTRKKPYHIYKNDGSYTVKLTVSNSAETDTETKYAYITVGSGQESPDSAFSADVTEGKNPLTVRFTDESSGNPSSWTWEFGDGYTSTRQNPEHTYLEAGSYTVKLIVGNSAGTDTETKDSYINVENAAGLPEAEFSADKTSGQAPLGVSFTDKSTGAPTAWKWEFGDGYTSTRQNPTHTYEKAGSYTVKLTASNPAGTDTETKYGYITVEETAGLLKADFSANRRYGNAPLTVLFSDKSTGDPTAWKWDFGDGYTSTRKMPYHIYKNAGSYTVKLTVSSAEGTDVETKYAYITVT